MAMSVITRLTDTIGQLIWKDINTITNGVYVDYRDDRIVFTDTNEWSTDFCAFVRPLTRFPSSYMLNYLFSLVRFSSFVS